MGELEMERKVPRQAVPAPRTSPSDEANAVAAVPLSRLKPLTESNLFSEVYKLYRVWHTRRQFRETDHGLRLCPRPGIASPWRKGLRIPPTTLGGACRGSGKFWGPGRRVGRNGNPRQSRGVGRTAVSLMDPWPDPPPRHAPTPFRTGDLRVHSPGLG